MVLRLEVKGEEAVFGDALARPFGGRRARVFSGRLRFNLKSLAARIKRGVLKVSSPSVQYRELLRAREVGKRNGRYYMLRRMGEWTKLALLEASIEYLRRGYRIVSAALRSALEEIVERLHPSAGMVSKVRILRRGLETALRLLEGFHKTGVLRWAPHALGWLKSEAYIEWLGTTCAL